MVLPDLKKFHFGNYNCRQTGIIIVAHHDLIEMQRLSWRYLNLLQERDLMLAHTSIVIRNNLLALAKKEEETRMAITQMAERIIQRFESLEKRVDQLEVTSQIHSWLLTIDQRDYDEQLLPHMRLLRVVRDFYNIKNSGWTWQELKYLQKAISEVGLKGKQKISIEDFICQLTDEIAQSSFNIYQELIQISAGEQDKFIPEQFMLENISVPLFTALHRIHKDYADNVVRHRAKIT